MRTLTIIPARAGSQRIPGKNWRQLGGRPLAAYALATVAATPLSGDVVVTSDSPEVLNLVSHYPDFQPIERPAELCTATSPAIAYVRHALDWMQARGRAGYDAVVIVQPTSPFTLPEDILGTIALMGDPAADSAASVVQLPHDLNPLKIKTLAPGGRLLPYLETEDGRMAAHELPTTYVRNGAVYAARFATVLGGKVIGDYCLGYPMPRERSVDLNDEFDWALAEFLLARDPLLKL